MRARTHTYIYISNYNDLPFILTDISYLCDSLYDFSYISRNLDFGTFRIPFKIFKCAEFRLEQ